MKNLISYSLGIVLLLISFGCGGGTAGTSGTGGFKSLKLISGSIVDPSGDPVVGAMVKVLGNNPSTTSDMNGKFEFEEEIGDQFTLSIEHNQVLYKLDVPVVESQTGIVNLDTVIDPDKKSVSTGTIEGSIKTFDCQKFALTNTNEIRFSLPTGVSSCNLEYSFRTRRAQPKNATLNVSASNCRGISFVQSGTQVAGDRVSVYQYLYIPKQKKLKGVCSATVTASFPGLSSKPLFKLRVKQGR